MAQTSAAKGAAQNKSANGIDPRRQAALDTALAQVERVSARDRPCDWAIVPSRMSR